MTQQVVRPLTPTFSLNKESMGRAIVSLTTRLSLWDRRYAGSAKIRLIHMGLLDHLWDDTVAGPRPENGLGKLRKHHTFASRSTTGKETETGSVRSFGDELPEEAVRVTRSIMIVKPPGYLSGSPPVSPAGSTPPVSPFSGESFRFRRRSASDAYEKRSQNRPSPSSPFDV